MESAGETRIISFNVNGLFSFIKRRGYNEQTFSSLLDNICVSDDAQCKEGSISKPEIICIQECKMSFKEDLNYNVGCPDGYESYFSLTTNNKRYSGVATYVSNKCALLNVIESTTGFSWIKTNPRTFELESRMCEDNINYIESEVKRIHDIFGYSVEEIDVEGRCVITDHREFIIINLYFPLIREVGGECENNEVGGPNCTSNVDLVRLKYRLAFHQYLFLALRVISEYSKRKMLLLGDFNIVLSHIDTYNRTLVFDSVNGSSNDNADSSLCSEMSLETFSQDLASKLETPNDIYDHLRKQILYMINRFNLCDVYRQFYPNSRFKYTCWNQMNQLRCKNQGSRIDLFLFSKDLSELIVNRCEIFSHIYGSDHCPIVIYLNNNKIESLTSKTSKHEKNSHSPPLSCSKYLPQCKQRQSSIYNFILNPNSVKTSNKTKSVEKVLDCSKSKNSPIPFCKHSIYCNKKKVSKPGKNRGRVYWVCSKPEKEKCDIFIWDDEYNLYKKQDLSNFITVNKNK